MARNNTRLRRTVVSGIKLGLTSTAAVATVAGWAAFAAADNTNQTPTADAAAIALQSDPPVIRVRHHHAEAGEQYEWRIAPNGGSADNQSAPSTNSAGGSASQSAQPSSGGLLGSLQSQDPTYQQSQPLSPLRPLLMTRSSR